MYPVDENVRLTEQGAAALMEMEGKEAMPMSGKKHCKGVDVVCPFWRCETPLTITCEGWMAGCDVQLRFSGQWEKLAYMRRRCKRMDGWRKCLVAVGAERKYEK